MMATRTILLLGTLLAVISDPAAPAPPPDYLSEVLDNGLRVSVLPDPSSPVVSTQLWYHVGAANEEPHSRGFAHLFEHLMFGKTTRHAKDEYAGHHHRHGGYENAYTTYDETVYVSILPPGPHAAVLEFEADRMVNLVLDEDNLANEKRIVSEELRLTMENDPLSRVGVAALKAVLGEHPYAYTPGGTREDVAAADLEQCEEFYGRYYRPRNAHLVVVGPVDGAKTMREIRERFASLPADGITPEDVPTLIEWDLADDVTLKEDLPPAEIAILAYPLPDAGSQDYWTVEVLLQLLGGGEVDPFEESLVNRRHKAVYASTDWMSTRRGGALMFNAAFVPYRRRSTAFRLMDRTRDELAQLAWLTPESLASAKRTLARRELNRVYYSDSRAEAIGRARWWHGDEQLAFDGIERIRAVTVDDVAVAFRAYVDQAQPIRVYLKPTHVPFVVRMFGWLYPLVNR